MALEDSSGSGSSWQDYAGSASGIFGAYTGIIAAQTEYASTVASANEQIERNELALTDRVNARQQSLNNDIASIKAGQASRGVEGAKGVISGKEKEAEQDITAMEIDTAQSKRELTYSKTMAKQQSDLAQTSSVIGGITSALTLGMG